MKVLSTVIVLGLCVAHVKAQDMLQVDVVEGQDAVVSAVGGRGANVRVRVLDRDRKPVEGAIVSAVLPSRGVGGHFRGGETISTTHTDSLGEAQFRGIHLRPLTGDFTTRILARRGDRTGTTQVTQKVSAAADADKGWHSRRRRAMLGVVGTGVAAGIVALLYGNESSTPAAAGPSVTPGSPVASAPR